METSPPTVRLKDEAVGGRSGLGMNGDLIWLPSLGEYVPEDRRKIRRSEDHKGYDIKIGTMRGKSSKLVVLIKSKDGKLGRWRSARFLESVSHSVVPGT